MIFGKAGNNRAQRYKNTRAVLAVVALTCVFVFALTGRQKQLSGTQTVMATITDIQLVTSENRYAGRQIDYVVTLRLPDRRQIRMTVLRQPPAVGTAVPILIDRYDDGTSYYRYNALDWAMKLNSG